MPWWGKVKGKYSCYPAIQEPPSQSDFKIYRSWICQIIQLISIKGYRLEVYDPDHDHYWCEYTFTSIREAFAYARRAIKKAIDEDEWENYHLADEIYLSGFIRLGSQDYTAYLYKDWLIEENGDFQFWLHDPWSNESIAFDSDDYQWRDDLFKLIHSYIDQVEFDRCISPGQMVLPISNLELAITQE